jgi:signal transduction histidine kinase
VRKISDFVQDMLSFSKARTPVREQVALRSLVDEATETFMDLFQQKNVDLRADLDAVTEPLSVDPQAIYRCLINILGNAAHALPSDHGRIDIRATPDPGGGVRIEISDNGPGVPERFRERIFDPFFSTKGSGGTGLGLAVTRKIIEEHGGGVVCLEAPNGGALFRILLPPSARAAAELGDPESD